MSNVIAFPVPAREKEPSLEGVRLGPATVLAADRAGLEVQLQTGQRVRAGLALGYAYEAAEGDVVLAIGNEGGTWIIGVIQGKGRATIAVEGDLEVHATGTLRLSGEKAVEVEGPEVRLQANKLTVLAGSVVQTFAQLKQRITELWSVHAAERHTVVEGASREQAKSATILTEEKMTINGKAIYLG